MLTKNGVVLSGIRCVHLSEEIQQQKIDNSNARARSDASISIIRTKLQHRGSDMTLHAGQRKSEIIIQSLNCSHVLGTISALTALNIELTLQLHSLFLLNLKRIKLN